VLFIEGPYGIGKTSAYEGILNFLDYKQKAYIGIEEGFLNLLDETQMSPNSYTMGVLWAAHKTVQVTTALREPVQFVICDTSPLAAVVYRKGRLSYTEVGAMLAEIAQQKEVSIIVWVIELPIEEHWDQVSMRLPERAPALKEDDPEHFNYARAMYHDLISVTMLPPCIQIMHGSAEKLFELVDHWLYHYLGQVASQVQGAMPLAKTVGEIAFPEFAPAIEMGAGLADSLLDQATAPSASSRQGILNQAQGGLTGRSIGGMMNPASTDAMRNSALEAVRSYMSNASVKGDAANSLFNLTQGHMKMATGGAFENTVPAAFVNLVEQPLPAQQQYWGPQLDFAHFPNLPKD